jgi:5-carboxymethyl-2-hydroxymuconate isomerase
VKRPDSGDARELFVRHAKKDGRSLAYLKAIDYGDSCVVEAEVFPVGARDSKPVQPGPYTFADVSQARAFVDESVEALLYLGCDVNES